MELSSKEYAWALVTADLCLSRKACELLQAILVPSAGGADATLYDGENATGVKIITLNASTLDNADFTPPQPVYCDRGLFVDVGTNVTAVFVQYRILGAREGE